VLTRSKITKTFGQAPKSPAINHKIKIRPRIKIVARSQNPGFRLQRENTQRTRWDVKDPPQSIKHKKMGCVPIYLMELLPSMPLDAPFARKRDPIIWIGVTSASAKRMHSIARFHIIHSREGPEGLEHHRTTSKYQIKS